MISAPATGSLATVLDIAATVPPAPSPLVDRQNMLDTVDQMFTSGVEVVCVEGDDGIGKTTLLLQAALRHSGSCACLYIRSVSRLAYDPSNLRFDLCNQLHWHVHSVTLPMEVEADDSVLRQKLLELSRRLGRARGAFYFIIDGLEDIPEADSFDREAILDMLPFGRKGFRFLISGAADRVLGNRSPLLTLKLTLKPFVLSPFSLGETKDYLADLVQDEGNIREIHLAVKGIPGKLSAIRRLVSSGLSPDRLLEEPPTEFRDLFELEWEQVPDEDKGLKQLLSLLAFSKTQVTLDDLAQVFRLTIEEVANRLSALTILRVDTSSNEAVFVSESIRQFARNKLRELERSVLDLHTEYLLTMPLSAPALQALPAYLEASGNEKRILEYLNQDYFVTLLTKARAFAPLTKSARLGAATAKKLGAHRDAIRFTLFSNILQGLATFRTRHAEIEALIAMDVYPAAIAAASLATLPEDRLQLFSLIARLKKEAGMEPEAALLDELQQTFREVTPGNVHPDKAMEIAADLLPVNPELAISLVEGAAKAGLGENALDAAIASLTIRAAMRDTEGRTHGMLGAVKERITDEKTQGLVGVLTEFLSPVSASALISELGRLERAGDKALLLRHWCVRHAQRDDALEAVQYGLDMALGSTAYSANAAYYRDLARPLQAASDIELASKLVRLFDGQDPILRTIGPTEDYVQLQLLLAAADHKRSREIAAARLVSLFDTIQGVSDGAAKATSLAHFIAGLRRIDPAGETFGSEGFNELASRDFAQALEALLESSADQYHACRNIIVALSLTCPQQALEVARRLNTLDRRDLAIRDVVKTFCKQPQGARLPNFIEDAIDEIDSPRVRDSAIIRVVESFTGNDFEATLLNSMLPTLMRLSSSAPGAAARCRALTAVLRAAYKIAQASLSPCVSQEHLQNKLMETWESLDRPWLRVDYGFIIATKLAPFDRTLAQAYVDQTNAYREQLELSSEESTRTLDSLCGLAIRAYSAMAAAGVAAESDMEKLRGVIDRIPGNGDRAALWGKLAIALYRAGNQDEAKQIALQRVRSLCGAIDEGNQVRRGSIYRDTAHALWAGNRTTVVETLDRLAAEFRDEGLNRICRFLLEKGDPDDPFERRGKETLRVDYDDAVNIVELLGHVEDDSCMHSVISDLCEAARASQKKLSLSRDQISDIVRRIEDLIDTRLPSPRFIRHRGYVIAAKASLATLRDDRSGLDSLVADARLIPNVADRVLVLTIIAKSLHAKQNTMRTKLLREAAELIEKVPSALDRLDRYEAVSKSAWECDRALAHSCMRMGLLLQGSGRDFYYRRQTLVDLAYSLDKDLPASIASLMNDDPAKKHMAEGTSHQVALLDFVRSIQQERTPISLPDAGHVTMLPAAAWRLLGQLRAGRAAPVHVARVRETLNLATELDFDDAFSVHCWAIENLSQMYKGTPQAGEYLRPLFESVLEAIELWGLLNAYLSGNRPWRSQQFGTVSTEESFSVRPGERDKALRIIEDWVAGTAADEILIVDPYFGPDDLSLLLMIKKHRPLCRVQILTSIKHHRDSGVPKPWDEEYRRCWVQNVSDHFPPDTEIVLFGIAPGGESPIHDRWLLSGEKGLRLGTSINSLGMKLSEISILNSQETIVRLQEVEAYTRGRLREHLGRRVEYSIFNLF